MHERREKEKKRGGKQKAKQLDMKTPFRHWFSTQISIQRKPLPDQEKQIKTRPE